MFLRHKTPAYSEKTKIKAECCHKMLAAYFATSKNLILKITTFTCHNSNTFAWTPPVGKIHNQIAHILREMRWHSSVPKVQSLRAAYIHTYSDTGHYSVVAKIMERLAVNKKKNNAQILFGVVQSQEIK
jgi:hypothetical protein